MIINYARYFCKYVTVVYNQTMATFKRNKKQGYLIPMFSGKVPAGFPSPADDHIEQHLDLNDLLISKPEATFLVRASGESMIQAGIFNQDILVVDRSRSAKHGDIVVASLDGELLVKRLFKHSGKLKLVSENLQFPEILISRDEELMIWGVVTYVIHKPI